jgi:hypothetical protein
MNDEAHVVMPDRFRYRPLQVGRDDKVGRVQIDRLRGHGVVDIQLDGYLVPEFGERHEEALAQAVEGVG